MYNCASVSGRSALLLCQIQSYSGVHVRLVVQLHTSHIDTPNVSQALPSVWLRHHIRVTAAYRVSLNCHQEYVYLDKAGWVRATSAWNKVALTQAHGYPGEVYRQIGYAFSTRHLVETKSVTISHD